MSNYCFRFKRAELSIRVSRDDEWLSSGAMVNDIDGLLEYILDTVTKVKVISNSIIEGTVRGNKRIVVLRCGKRVTNTPIDLNLTMCLGHDDANKFKSKLLSIKECAK